MAVDFQEGRFDHPDRLFSLLGDTWATVSKQGTSQIMELIPEFFSSPYFLMNLNEFDFGARTDLQQRRVVIDDVALPPWAHSSAHYFIERHLESLESKYVSAHLPDWIDLIFGYKQKGQAAVDALNVFHPLSYEGAVDVETMSDPHEIASTLSIINNFGQTPRQLFTAPHPRRARVATPGKFAAIEKGLIEKSRLFLLQQTIGGVVLHPPSPLRETTGARVRKSNNKQRNVFHSSTEQQRSAEFTETELNVRLLRIWDVPHKLFVETIGSSTEGKKPIVKLSFVLVGSERRLLGARRNQVLVPHSFTKRLAWGGEQMEAPDIMCLLSEEMKCIQKLGVGNSNTVGGFYSSSCVASDLGLLDSHPGTTNCNDLIMSCDDPPFSKIPPVDLDPSLLPFSVGLKDASCAISTATLSAPFDAAKIKPSLLVVGMKDSSIRVCKLHQKKKRRFLTPVTILCGHNAPISTICVSRSFNVIVTGDLHGTCIVWNLVNYSFVHKLHCFAHSPVISISVDDVTGNILILSSNCALVFSINAEFICMHELQVREKPRPRTVKTMLDGLKAQHSPFTCGSFVYFGTGVIYSRSKAIVTVFIMLTDPHLYFLLFFLHRDT
jgi:hypothetical protein